MPDDSARERGNFAHNSRELSLSLSLSNLFGERGHAAFLHCRIFNCWLRCVFVFLMRINSLSFLSFLRLLCFDLVLLLHHFENCVAVNVQDGEFG